jgi:hypothetical protein
VHVCWLLVILIDTYAVKQLLIDLHESYLKDNKYDESNLIYYRINYKLMDTFEMTKEDAENFHIVYHEGNRRRISEGYCPICNDIISIIPIIYGVSEKEKANLTIAENEGRVIIGSLDKVKEGINVSMFGCKRCKSDLPRYGTVV